jgi:hypothetical protein
MRCSTDQRNIPMRHHLEAAIADGVDNLGTLLDIGHLQLLLQKDRRLLVGRLDNSSHKDVVRRR